MYEAADHAERRFGHPDGDVEPRAVAGRLALSGEPAMRLRQLSEWNVPGRSEGNASLGCAVQPELAMRKWHLFGQTWAQAVSVR